MSDPIAAPTSPPVRPWATRPGRSVAVGLLTTWLVALFLVPARLALGQFGALSVVVGVALTVLWLASVLADGAFRGGKQPMRTALLAFVATVVVGYMVALSRVLTAGESGAANRTAVVYGSAIGVALFTIDSLVDREDLYAVVRRVVWCGLFLAGLGAIHSLAGIELASRINLPLLSWDQDLAVGIERVSFDRAVGTATHPIEYGVVLTMILPFAIHLALIDHRGQRTRWWTAAALIGAAAMFSLSRSAAIGLVITLVATLFALPTARLRQRFVLGLAVSAVALQVVAPGLIRTIRGLFLDLPADGSFQARVVDYRAVDRYIENHLWLGRGLGTFRPDEYLLLDNQMLKLILEIGLLGAAAFMGLLGVGLLVGRTVRRHAADPDLADLGRTLQVTVLIGFVTCFTFDFLGFTIARSLLFLTLGLLGAVWRLAALPSAASGSEHHRRAATSHDGGRADPPVGVLAGSADP